MIWTQDEIDFVKTNYLNMSDTEIATYLCNHNRNAIRTLRRKLNLIKPRIKDLSGRRIGNVTILRYTGKTSESTHSAIWECKLDDGTIVEIPSNNLHIGKTKLLRGLKPSEHHNKSHTRLYQIWKNMRKKCNNKNHLDYKYYGARGISCCSDWEKFSAFEQWAINNGYDETAVRGKCTLDRIDVNGNYEPNNCRWVNSEIQSINRRPYGKYPYYGLSFDDSCYCISVVSHRRKFHIGKTKNIEEIPKFLMLRNLYILENNLKNSVNIVNSHEIIKIITDIDKPDLFLIETSKWKHQKFQ